MYAVLIERYQLLNRRTGKNTLVSIEAFENQNQNFSYNRKYVKFYCNSIVFGRSNITLKIHNF